jgi:3-deoxy-D-manno-octulosonate 8-phosphate phosphatase (KDO 8-P phosphatase)
MMNNFREGLVKIKAFIFDVDGVLGSDKVLLHPNGDMLRTMNIKDGYAMQYAVRKGYKIAIITGGASELVKVRFEKLGIVDVYMKSDNKLDDYNDFMKKYGFVDEEILYMGDDLPDYEVMQHAGIPTCPSSAVEEIKSIAQYISNQPGGDGAVRDVIQQVMRLLGIWMASEAFIW